VSESGAAAESDGVPSCSAALRGAEIDLLRGQVDIQVERRGGDNDRNSTFEQGATERIRFTERAMK